MTDRTVGNGGLRRHRFVVDEPEIPFDCRVLFESEHVLAIDKPHFLATMPRGMWYRQTALVRMRERTGNPELSPAHRLDRATAGIVVLVKHARDRGAYQTLFERRKVEKTYECLAPAVPADDPGTLERLGRDLHPLERLDPPALFPLVIRSHIHKTVGVLQASERVLGTADPGFRRTNRAVRARGGASPVIVPNAETLVEVKPDSLLTASDRQAMAGHPGTRVYVLHPRTGKTHQLRVQMNDLGLPIIGDDLYPRVVERAEEDFGSPLRLVARTLRMTDPFSHEEWTFVSKIPL